METKHKGLNEKCRSSRLVLDWKLEAGSWQLEENSKLFYNSQEEINFQNKYI